MRGFIGGLIAFGSSAVGMILYVLVFVGWAYWMWMGIQLGSFGMFILGLLGPIAVVCAFLGAWSFLFGIPKWLLAIFT